MPGALRASRKHENRTTLAVVFVSVASFTLQLSMVVPALTTIQTTYDTDQATVTWVLTAYLVSASVATPLLGRMGDLLGKRRIFVLSLVALAVGSGLAAIAPTIEVLILARIVQGVGGGVLPLSLAIVRDTVTSKVNQRLSLIASLAALGFGAGIVLAGPILQALGLAWLFLLPMIATSVAAAAALIVIPRDEPRAATRLPWVPGLLLAAWLVGLLVTVTQGGAWGWTSARTWATIIATLILALAWLVVELRGRSTLIDLKLMGARGIWTANVIALCAGFSVYAALSCLPQFVHTPAATGYGFGASVSEAGRMLLPWSLGSFTAGMVTAHLVQVVGPRVIVIVGTMVTASSFGLLAGLHSQPWHVYSIMLILGIGSGLVFSALALVVIDAATSDKIALATAVNANIRTIGGAIGSAVLATMITAQTDAAGYPVERGYVAGFLVLATAMVIAAGVGWYIPHVRTTPRVQERFVAEIAAAGVPAVDPADSGPEPSGGGDKPETGRPRCDCPSS